MFENIGHFFKRIVKTEQQKELGSKDAAKERLHLVLMQDRANVSADFLELMKQEIIDVIKKYIVVDEDSIDVRLTNQENEDGTNGAPSLYANIPIVNIKNDMMAEKIKSFEGVDFNKEMGIPSRKEQVQAPKIEMESKQETQTVINLSAPTPNNVDEEDAEELFEEVDDDDDDVTFDDLLKAAEAEDELKNNVNSSKVDEEKNKHSDDDEIEIKTAKKETKPRTKKKN